LAGAADSTQATNEIVIPKSVFVTNDVRGKDPFFPNRVRGGLTATPTNVVPTPPGPNIKDLQLRGISGPPENRIALINNLTFKNGETNEVRLIGGKVKVRVLEIREKSVLLEIEGVAGPIELFLQDRIRPISD
jgi:hypothetical protein